MGSPRVSQPSNTTGPASSAMLTERRQGRLAPALGLLQRATAVQEAAALIEGVPVGQEVDLGA